MAILHIHHDETKGDRNNPDCFVDGKFLGEPAVHEVDIDLTLRNLNQIIEHIRDLLEKYRHFFPLEEFSHPFTPPHSYLKISSQELTNWTNKLLDSWAKRSAESYTVKEKQSRLRQKMEELFNMCLGKEHHWSSATGRYASRPGVTFLKVEVLPMPQIIENGTKKPKELDGVSEVDQL